MTANAEADAAFLNFHRKNPHCYSYFVKFARDVKRVGKRIGAKAVWERMRFEMVVTTQGEEFNLNNSYVSRMARLAMAQEPDLAGFFETRKLKTKPQPQPVTY